MVAYCIAEQRAGIKLPKTGVAGAPIRSLRVAALRCFVSDFDSPLDRERLPEFAQAFHQALQRIFAQTAIIPFRFPTVIESEKELKQFIEGRSEEYRAALKRVHNKVQMDIRIFPRLAGRAEGNSGPKKPSLVSSRISGKKYLEGKRDRQHEIESCLAAIRHAAEALADGWVQRDTPGGMRAFVLVERSSLPVFLEKIRQVRTHPGFVARVTGPWPPSEFVEIGDEQMPGKKQLR